MAQLKNKWAFNADPSVWEGKIYKIIKVGHNRTVMFRDDSLYCRIRSNEVVTVTMSKDAELFVKLDTCRYMTKTTLAAMNDFVRALGISVFVSRAGGVLSVIGNVQNIKYPDDNMATFQVGIFGYNV